MRVERVNTQSDDLDITFFEFWFQLCRVAKLGCANRRVILWVRKQNTPAVAKPIMKFDLALGCLSCKIGSFVTKSDRHKLCLLLIAGLARIISDEVVNRNAYIRKSPPQRRQLRHVLNEAAVIVSDRHELSRSRDLVYSVFRLHLVHSRLRWSQIRRP